MTLKYTIPKTAVSEIEYLANNTRSGKKLKIENIYKIYSFIIKLIIYNKKEYNSSHAEINSTVLAREHSRYYNYTKFLIKYNFLHKRNYLRDIGKSNEYDLHYNYYDDDFTVITNKNNESFKSQYLTYADSSIKKYKFLIQPFEDISIKYNEATKFINEQRSLDKISKDQALAYKYCIAKYNASDFYFKKPLTDKRFHTNLTSTPRALRKFISYNEKPLINLDLKNSQPYFLAVVLNIIITKDLKALNKLKKVITKVQSKQAPEAYNYFKIIKDLMNIQFSKSEIKEIQNYIHSACSGKFYELLASKLDIKYNKKAQIIKVKYDKSKKRQITKVFNSYSDDSLNKRDYAKQAAFQVFFASSNSKDEDANQIKKCFPTLWNLTSKLKLEHSSNFPVLLQNIESFVILDNLAKDIYKVTKAPIFTIHDSIATTEEYIKEAEAILLDNIQELTGLCPSIDTEKWA